MLLLPVGIWLARPRGYPFDCVIYIFEVNRCDHYCRVNPDLARVTMVALI